MNYKEIKINCFAYDGATIKCTACKDLNCNKCAFYKKNRDDNYSSNSERR